MKYLVTLLFVAFFACIALTAKHYYKEKQACEARGGALVTSDGYQCVKPI